MKYLLLALACVCSVAFPAQSARINFSSNTLGTSYNTSFPQAALTKVPPTNNHVYLYNGASSEIACNLTQQSASVAPSSNVNDLYIPATTGIVLDGMGVSNVIYCRSNSGSSLTSGYLIVYTY